MSDSADRAAISAILDAADSEGADSSAKDLDRILNVGLLPCLAFQMVVFGLIILDRYLARDASLDFFAPMIGVAGLLVGGAICLSLISSIRTRGPHADPAPAQMRAVPFLAPTAAFFFIAAGLMLTVDQLSAYVLSATIFFIMTLLAWQKRVRPHEIAFSIFYFGALIHAHPDPFYSWWFFGTFFIVAVIVLVVLDAAVLIWFALLGFAVVLNRLAAFQPSTDLYHLLPATVFLTITGSVGVIVYDTFFLSNRRLTEFEHFFCQGVSALVVFLIVGNVLSNTALEEFSGYIFAVGFGVYAGFMSRFGEQECRVARSAWATLTIVLFIWLNDGRLITYLVGFEVFLWAFRIMIVLTLVIAIGMAQFSRQDRRALFSITGIAVVLAMLWLFQQHIFNVFGPAPSAEFHGLPIWQWSVAEPTQATLAIECSLLLVIYLVGLVCAANDFRLADPMRALWRSVHLTLVGRVGEDASERIKDWPIVGFPIYVFGASAKLLRFLNGGTRTVPASDILVIVLTIFAATIGADQLAVTLDSGDARWMAELRLPTGIALPVLASWTFFGSLYYAFGIWRRQPIYYFIGAILILYPLALNLSVLGDMTDNLEIARKIDAAELAGCLFIASGVPLFTLAVARRVRDRLAPRIATGSPTDDITKFR